MKKLILGHSLYHKEKPPPGLEPGTSSLQNWMPGLQVVEKTSTYKLHPELVSPRVSVTPQTAAADARLAAVVEALALAWPGMSEATRKELEKIVGACRCGKM